jgi:hypothetical protein
MVSLQFLLSLMSLTTRLKIPNRSARSYLDLSSAVFEATISVTHPSTVNVLGAVKQAPRRN